MSTTINGDVVINGPVTINIVAREEKQEETCCGGFDSDTCCKEQEDEDIVKSIFGHAMRDEDEDEEEFPEEEIVTMADVDKQVKILEAIEECEGDFVFDTGEPSKVHCWTINSGDTPEFVCNLGFDKIRMAVHDKFNMRLDVALTKEAAIEIRDFLANLDLGNF